MAGIGKRMRPHSLTIPKPLIPVAGKPIVEHLVEDIVHVIKESVSEIAFVIGEFGTQVEEQLLRIAECHNIPGKIYYQKEALGTAHAVQCAADSLSGKIIVAFADTLFKYDKKVDINMDSGIFVQKVDNPSSYGVVKVDKNNIISGFVEKPKEFVSDLAIIGIYYFREGETLKQEIQYLLDHNLRGNNEFQLTDALCNMKDKGMRFHAVAVEEWYDCGNKEKTLTTNQKVLQNKFPGNIIAESAEIDNSRIIAPCCIREDVKIRNSVIGPYVSIGTGTIIERVIAENCIIQADSSVTGKVIKNSMIGQKVTIFSEPDSLNIGDYNEINENPG